MNRPIRCAASVFAAAFAALGVASCGSDTGTAAMPSTVTVTATTTETITARPRSTERAAPTASTTTEAVEATTRTPARTTSADAMSASRRNAVQKGRDYLDMSAFSRQGLIEQLAYEGFTESDATFAVDSLSPNWTQQAKKKAAEYMEMTAFSQQGLVEQLVYEGFSQAQAEAGAASQF
ncbi:Ltp family lipoprotein [Gordonia humi]